MKKLFTTCCALLLVAPTFAQRDEFGTWVEVEAEKKKIRGLLVAPSIMDDALEMIEEEGIEFVSVEPPRELKRDKKVTLDFF
jgi:RecB family endonuclease NucS